MLNIQRISNSRTNDFNCSPNCIVRIKTFSISRIAIQRCLTLIISLADVSKSNFLKNSHNFDKCQSAKRLALLKRPKLLGGYTILRLPFGHASGNDLIFAKLQPLKRHAKHASLFLHRSSFFTTQSSLFWPNG